LGVGAEGEDAEGGEGDVAGGAREGTAEKGVVGAA
jgi:hypothetical protein